MASASCGEHKNSTPIPRCHGSDIKLSKSLAWLLRHGATKKEIVMDSSGFVLVKDILKLKQFSGFGITDINRVVEQSDKKRFALKFDADGLLMIRANQGHSLTEVKLEMTELKHGDISCAIHGTYHECIDSILKKGLSRMTRQHIHMAIAEPGKDGVISGMRSSCNVIVVIDVNKAILEGLRFFRSENGVILCAGDDRGFVSPKYFSEVRDRKTGQKF